MNNLLTAQDVLRMTFKKAIRGYDAEAVDSFREDVLETLREYAEKISRLEQKCAADREKLAEFEQMRSVMHDTLLMAQKSADEKIAAAKEEAERIIAAAEAKAENIRNGAYDEKKGLFEELARIKEIRELYMSEAKGLVERYGDILAKAAQPTAVSSQAEEIIRSGEKFRQPAEEKKAEIPKEAVKTEIAPAEAIRFEYEEFRPVTNNSAEVPETDDRQSGEFEFRLYDSEELIKADSSDEPQPEKSEEELSAEQLAAAEKTAFTDKNQSNLFGNDADPMRLRKEIRYAKTDSLDD